MTTTDFKQRIEFGDFQTPDDLALQVCARLKTLGINPDLVIEPTCGVGAFLLASAVTFPKAKKFFGFEINLQYLDVLRHRLLRQPFADRVQLEVADFFSTNWQKKLDAMTGRVLVIGNFPWVTNSTQGVIGGKNLPEKSNFLKQNGFDAISGKANFDISEWMLLDVLSWLRDRSADVAMLVKTATARKVLSHAAKQKCTLSEAFIINIDAKKSFGASVDACLLIMRLEPTAPPCFDYTVYSSLDALHGKRIGKRQGMMVGDLDAFAHSAFLLGTSPQKWRSGIKHDASSVMEFTRRQNGYENGLGETVQLESTYLFPLLKGSDVGNNKEWREKFVLVTQRFVGEETRFIARDAPLTWRYLKAHAAQLDARGSTIYKNQPDFSIFGIGEYAFQPWRIAICGLYKKLNFRLVRPIEGRPVMFDDTTYYLSFDTENEAVFVFEQLHSKPVKELLLSLIFWDEKRPIKTGILNMVDWSRLYQIAEPKAQLELNMICP